MGPPGLRCSACLLETPQQSSKTCSGAAAASKWPLEPAPGPQMARNGRSSLPRSRRILDGCRSSLPWSRRMPDRRLPSLPRTAECSTGAARACPGAAECSTGAARACPGAAEHARKVPLENHHFYNSKHMQKHDRFQYIFIFTCENMNESNAWLPGGSHRIKFWFQFWKTSNNMQYIITFF